jgi:biopolymer transport protein ExbD
MAGVDVGGGGGKRREIATDINMIPFIDLLFVTIAFLLITAVWVQAKQISSNAEVPGERGPTPPKVTRDLEVAVRDASFELTWREGGTVIVSQSVPRKATVIEGQPTYPDLAKELGDGWQKNASIPSDCRSGCQTTAVLRTDDKLPFSEIVAVLDALAQKQHEATLPDGRTLLVPAFNTTFSSR